MASSIEVKRAVSAFLAMMEGEPSTDPDDAANLLLDHLDHLSLLARHVGFEFEEGPDAPPKDLREFGDLASRRFPNHFTYYNVPEFISIKPSDTGLTLGDPYDDIGDIAADMWEVQWLFENASDAVALWQFAWGYQNHWGEHASNLRWYLYAFIVGH